MMTLQQNSKSHKAEDAVLWLRFIVSELLTLRQQTHSVQLLIIYCFLEKPHLTQQEVGDFNLLKQPFFVHSLESCHLVRGKNPGNCPSISVVVSLDPVGVNRGGWKNRIVTETRFCSITHNNNSWTLWVCRKLWRARLKWVGQKKTRLCCLLGQTLTSLHDHPYIFF